LIVVFVVAVVLLREVVLSLDAVFEDCPGFIDTLVLALRYAVWLCLSLNLLV
jgi:hypothetical protein